MKRSTAMSRLSDIAEGLDRAVQWSEVTVIGAYVSGGLLESDALIETIELALVVAEPPEVVPWMARPARLEALAEMLRLPKLPVSWWWRPAEWPVWNHSIVPRCAFGAPPMVEINACSTGWRPAGSRT